MTENQLCSLTLLHAGAQREGLEKAILSQLLKFRDDPIKSKSRVRELVAKKLVVIEQRIYELTALRDEFSQLTEQCINSKGGCPILKKFEVHKK